MLPPITAPPRNNPPAQKKDLATCCGLPQPTTRLHMGKATAPTLPTGGRSFAGVSICSFHRHLLSPGFDTEAVGCQQTLDHSDFVHGSRGGRGDLASIFPQKTMFSPEICYTTKALSQLRTSNTAIPSSQEKYLPRGALRSLSYVCKELGLTGEARRERSRPADGLGSLAASPASAPAGSQHLRRRRQHKCLTGGTPEGAFFGGEGGRQVALGTPRTSARSVPGTKTQLNLDTRQAL